MTKLPSLIAALLILSVAQMSAAASDSPAGIWKSIDDETGHPKSIIQISEQQGGELTAKVVRILESDRGPHPVCSACRGDRKDKPIEGMTIMWGVRKNGNVWDGGRILDPQIGKTYSVKLALTDSGRKLDVHGYLGISLLGRSQTWVREQ
ncbi:MAG: DUF2147 domain-containing protein [Verrucomicrobiota bacterium]|nr:DUF2147 domain-containing protein [Verrucomicrobiota bacterium]